MPQPQKQAPFVPIYQRLVNDYKDDIITRKYKPGDRIDSINQVRRLHHVSRETAKTVLKILARDGYIIQRPGKGSFVADLRPRKKLWGLVLPFYSVQYEDLLNRLSRKAWALGRQLHHYVDYNSWEEEIRLVGRLINQRYEAVVIVPTLDESKTAEFYSTFMSRATSVALIDHTMAGSAFSYVIQSYDLGVQRGMNYLLERTPRTIAFVRNEIWAGRNLVQELMEETYRTIIDAQRGEGSSLVVDRVGSIDAAFVRDNGIEGIFCCDDADALRVTGRLGEQGVRVPDDFRLVSYGNTDLARYFTPAITSIDPHNEEMAETTVRILRKKIGGDSTEFSQYVVQPELVVRTT